jgi:hypothetical protein
MNLFRILIALFIATTIVYASGKEIALSLGLGASTKASKQWIKVFQREKKMKKLGIDKLSDADKDSLKKYLISHAADSDHPEAAGM